MENNARKTNLNSKLLCGVAALLVLAVVLVVFLWPSNVARELTVEAGRTGIEADLFLKKDKGDHAQFVTDVSAIDLSAIGEYPVTISYGGKNYDCTLIVKDTIAPEAQVRNLAIYSHVTPEPEEFIVSIKDATAVTVQYEKRVDLTEDGSYLLAPNPVDPRTLQLAVGPYVLPIKAYDNTVLATSGTKVPMILGDLKSGIAYWQKKALTIKASDVAVAGDLNAFEEELILWRGSMRSDCTLWDDTAFVNGYVDTGAAG